MRTYRTRRTFRLFCFDSMYRMMFIVLRRRADFDAWQGNQYGGGFATVSRATQAQDT